MPFGKPAGVACIQLDENGRCRIFDHPERPAVCSSLQAEPGMCGNSREHALRWLGHLEELTAPNDRATNGRATNGRAANDRAANGRNADAKAASRRRYGKIYIKNE